MTSPILRVSVRRDPEADRVSADGELDIASSPQLADTLAGAVAEGRATDLDLSGLRFCDVPGVHLLRDAAASALRAGVPFRVSGVHGEVARLLGVLRVSLPA
jgi:anti-sigma B factor antagonist